MLHWNFWSFTEKNKKLMIFYSHFLIWSSKIPKGGCICYKRFIFWRPKTHNSFYLWLLEFYFFWLQKLVLKETLQILSRHLIYQKSTRRSSPLNFYLEVLNSSASKASQVQLLQLLAKNLSQKLKSANIG